MPLDDFDRQEINEIVAQKIDILSAFKGLDVAQLEQLGADLEPFLYARQYALRKPKNAYTPRVTVSGNDINSNAAAVGSGHAGPTLPRWIDFAGATGYLDTDDPQMVHIQAGGGGADCMFSVLVSTCWSSVTGWVEGATYTSLSGCTFYTSLTPQLAADYIRDHFSNSGIIAICKGSYDGGMHIHHSTQVAVLGAGREQTIIKGANPQAEVVNGYVADAGTNGQNAAVVLFRDLTFDGTIGTGTPSVAVFGNQNASTVTLNNIQINVPASNNGAQFNGKETISGLRIIGPSSGTQATTGFTSTNNTATDGHNAQQVYISGCDRGMRFTNASLWNINGLYVTGANAARGDSNGTGAIAVHTGPGLTNSVIENVNIDNCIVGIGFTNAGGSGCQFRSFVINNCDFGIDIRGTVSGMTNNVFDGFSMILGTAGDIGVTFSTSDSTPGCAYSQFTNFNFKGYASGNEFASTANIGTGTVGYHNISDAGTVADFGSPLGHAGSGTGGAAPNSEAFVTIGNSANLSAERALTAGTGITITDAGANSTVTVAAQAAAATFVLGDATVVAGLANYEVLTQGNGIGVTQNSGTHLATVALGNLTGNWSPTGAFDITTLGKQTSTAQIAAGLTGATAASRYVGATASGSPASGTFAIGDFVIDQTGKIYVCTVAGTPGTWTQVGAATVVAHELLWFSQTPTSGDNLAYTPIRFNGLGATAISPMSVTAKDYGYGTTRINLLRAPNAHTVSATGGLPNPVFTTILNTDLNIESSHMTFTGMEDVTISGGAVSGTTLAFDDMIRCDYDAVNNAVDMTPVLSITT